MSATLRLKYIIIRTEIGEMPILFPETVLHKHAVDGRENKPVSAGFWELHAGTVHAFGRSDSLGLASRGEDAQIIADALKLTGVL